jgi:ribonuclease HII
MLKTLRNMAKKVQKGALSAAKQARKTFDKLSVDSATMYIDGKGRRINKTKNGAVFTKNVKGDRNYKPVAAAIKKDAKSPKVTITSATVMSVPKKIRSKK